MLFFDRMRNARAENPDDETIADEGDEGEADVEEAQHVLHRVLRLGEREPVLGDVHQFVSGHVPPQHSSCRPKEKIICDTQKKHLKM
jgi:hypothetical protein